MTNHNFLLKMQTWLLNLADVFLPTFIAYSRPAMEQDFGKPFKVGRPYGTIKYQLLLPNKAWILINIKAKTSAISSWQISNRTTYLTPLLLERALFIEVIYVWCGSLTAVSDLMSLALQYWTRKKIPGDSLGLQTKPTELDEVKWLLWDQISTLAST